MTTAVTRLYRFSASHRLHQNRFSEGENSRLYGKCNNPFGHGHDYLIEVTVEGPVANQSGFVVGISQLDDLVQNQVLNLFDHRNINLDVPQFSSLVPTTENMTKVISDILRQNWKSYVSGSGRLSRVHIQETDRNGFEVLIPAEEMDSTKRVSE